MQLGTRVERMGADMVENESCVWEQTTYRRAAQRIVTVCECEWAEGQNLLLLFASEQYFH